jgi:peroxin-10
MKWGYAETSVITRNHQKDQFYIHQLDEKVRQIISLRKVYRWIGADTLPISTALYYILTTLQGTKTLGEEYCKILPVDVVSGTLPTIWKRLALILTPWLSRYLGDDIPALHRVLFYWDGKYPELIRRILSLRYIYHPRRPPISNDGWLYATLAMVALPVTMYKLVTRLREEQDTEEGEPSQKCSLCLEKRKDATITNCGHLFCWQCIFGWLKMREECPLCRNECKLAQLYCVLDPFLNK